MTSSSQPRIQGIFSLPFFSATVQNPSAVYRQGRRGALWDGNKALPVPVPDGIVMGWFNGTWTHRKLPTTGAHNGVQGFKAVVSVLWSLAPELLGIITTSFHGKNSSNLGLDCFTKEYGKTTEYLMILVCHYTTHLKVERHVVFSDGATESFSSQSCPLSSHISVQWISAEFAGDELKCTQVEVLAVNNNCVVLSYSHSGCLFTAHICARQAAQHQMFPIRKCSRRHMSQRYLAVENTEHNLT